MDRATNTVPFLITLSNGVENMTLLKSTRTPRFCSTPGCGRKHRCKGYCDKHYRHHKNTGRLCSIEGCGEAYECSGYCKNHYWRWLNHGDPHSVKCNHGKGHTPEEKFWSRVDKTPGLGPQGECWEWRGRPGKKGYALTRYLGKARIVHRIAWYLEHGVFPLLWVLHSCDNPICVNIGHLREGTPGDNTEDMVSRNRQAKGERAGNVKLTTELVRYICQQRKQGVICQDISDELGINNGTVSRIARGKSWRWLK